MRELEPDFVIYNRTIGPILIYRVRRRRGVWGRAVVLTLAVWAGLILAVAARAEELKTGAGIVCDEPNLVFAVYDQTSTVTDGARGWDIAFQVMTEINSRVGRDACFYAGLVGTQGPVVASKNYGAQIIEIDEVTIHATLTTAGRTNFSPPRTMYNGRLVRLVS
jgi:hypothetical protein